MKLQFTRSVLAQGEHREAGSIHEIEECTAVQILSDGAAILARSSIETAEAKHPEKETAARKNK